MNAPQFTGSAFSRPSGARAERIPEEPPGADFSDIRNVFFQKAVAGVDGFSRVGEAGISRLRCFKFN